MYQGGRLCSGPTHANLLQHEEAWQVRPMLLWPVQSKLNAITSKSQHKIWLDLLTTQYHYQKLRYSIDCNTEWAGGWEPTPLQTLHAVSGPLSHGGLQTTRVIFFTLQKLTLYL